MFNPLGKKESSIYFSLDITHLNLAEINAHTIVTGLQTKLVYISTHQVSTAAAVSVLFCSKRFSLCPQNTGTVLTKYNTICNEEELEFQHQATKIEHPKKIL